MSATTTHNLPYKRFVAQVSTGAPRPKSTYLSLMAENLEALKACPWREASDVSVALVDHDFTKANHISDAYDAFKMTGGWNSTDQTETAFAGMAAYRFKIPTAAASVAISSIALPISRDRFLKGGVHVAAVRSSSATPSTDWSTVTGAGASAYLANTAANIVATQPADGTLTIETPADTGGYLWIYVTLEDYTDWWDKYSATEARQYAIEGSAMLVGGSAVVTFASAVAPDDDAGPAVLLAGGSSPTWLQPLPTVNVTATPPTLASVTEPFFTSKKSLVTPLTNNLELGGWVRISCVNTTITAVSVWDSQSSWRPCTLQNGLWRTGSYTTNSGTYEQRVSCGFYDGVSPDGYARINCTASRYRYYSGQFNYQDSISLSTTSDENVIHVQSVENYYLLLLLANGVPILMDKCSAPTMDGRQNLSSVVSGSESPWTIVLDGVTYGVAASGQSFTLTADDGATALGTFDSVYNPSSNTAFDPAARARMPGDAANAKVADYGLASALGDFSHAVATFEAGTQPPNAEVLGRLARMSRAATGGMLYLHPASAALADELDALRPVPRFFRTDSEPPEQTDCQPGLSVWYRRPTTTANNVTTASSASVAFAYRNGAGESVVKVTNPAFLQLTLLALRAPSAFASRLVLENVGEAAVHNGFVLRFVAWRCPAEQWDGSNGFAMAAMASMPSIYRSDGDGSVSWSVGCSGALMPLGTRMMTAERIGASEVVDTDIAATTGKVEIPLVGDVKAGDVVLIAPEVLGFASGGEAASAHFGRQADPVGNAAEDHGYAWARYDENLGWFPHVKGE